MRNRIVLAVALALTLAPMRGAFAAVGQDQARDYAYDNQTFPQSLAEELMFLRAKGNIN